MRNSTSSCSHLTIGLDLGNKKSDYCMIDQAHKVLSRGALETNRAVFEHFFRGYPGALVVCEVGGHSRWVQKLARKIGLRIIVADARQIALISKSHRKNDKRDAHILALAGSALPELLHPVEHKNDQYYEDLAVLQSRNMLTSIRTMLVNRIKGICKAQGHPLTPRGGRAFHKKAAPAIPPKLRPATNPLFAMLKAIEEQIASFTKELDRIATRYPAVAKLRQINGVGIQTALTFVLTICDPNRFQDTRTVAAYLGLVPRQRSSGESVPQMSITKAGNTDLRRLLVLCGHYILGHFGKNSYLRRWGLSLCQRGGKNGKKRACVAVARKLAVLMLALWKSNHDYDPTRHLGTLEVI